MIWSHNSFRKIVKWKSFVNESFRVFKDTLVSDDEKSEYEYESIVELLLQVSLKNMSSLKTHIVQLQSSLCK